MNEDLMTTGFTGGDAATGPTAGYDPVMKFRRKLKDKKKEEKKGYHVMPDGTMMPGNTHKEEKDHEVSMAQAQLDKSSENIKKLKKKLGKKEKNIPAWVQAKITDTEHNTDAASGYVNKEDWQKVNRKDKTDGLSQKAVNAYRKENPGSKLKTAVTTKPSKLKKGSKDAKRRSSFCSRMKGMKKRLTSAKTARDPDSRINKALRRWNCN